MRKLLAALIFSFVLLVPLSLVVKPAFAEEDAVATEDSATSSDDSSYDSEYYYDDSYYTDDYYSSYGYDDWDTTAESTGFLAGATALLFGGVMLFFTIVVGAGSYVYCSLALMKIAKRLNHESPWYAWIPILNIVLLFQLGEQNPMLLLLLLIPGIGEVVVGILSIIALMKICEKRGYDKALGLLSLVPIANFVLLGILAWGKKEA